MCMCVCGFTLLQHTLVVHTARMLCVGEAKRVRDNKDDVTATCLLLHTFRGCETEQEMYCQVDFTFISPSRDLTVRSSTFRLRHNTTAALQLK
jgi:hypothetical protein